MHTDRPAIESFAASDGYRFAYRHWPPGRTIPAGYVVALHGIQSHSGWYEFSSRQMCEAGFDVRFLDRRGSGRNTADRGHARHADRLVADVLQFLQYTSHERDRQAPEAPVILLAVSWGGKLAVTCAARRSRLVDGLALLYPGLKAKVHPNWFQRSLLRLGMALGKSRRSVSIPLDDPALFTDDPDWQRFIRADQLALHEATLGLLSASLTLDRALDDAAAEIRCPVLLMLAGQDRIIDNEATRECFERFPAADKTVLVYENAAHTLEFEPNREEICAELTSWLAKVRLGHGTPA